MKNSNLLNRLLSYSHEKQSPQRLRRYAVMLLMLLTLGVGQMWGKLILVDMGSAPNWYDNAHIHYYSGSDKYVALESTGITNIYKATIPDSHGNGWRLCRYVNGTRYNDGNWISDNTATNKRFTYGGSSATSIIGLVTGGHILFDNSKTKWSDAYKYFVIGRDDNGYYGTYGGNAAARVVTNTLLWDFDIDGTQWWNAGYYAIMGHSGNYPSANKAWSDIDTYANHKTSQYTNSYSLENGSIYLCVPSSGTGKPTFTITYKNGYSALNSTVTLKAKVSTNGGSSYSEASTPGALSASSYKFTSWNSCGSTTGTSTTLSAGSASSTFTAGYTANTSVSAADVTGYDFAGWYEGSTKVLDGSTGTMNPHGAVTLYAYYKVKQYTVSYGVNSSTRYGSITLNSGSAVSTTSSSTLNHGTAISFNATPNDGYTVEGWYSDAACTAGNKLQSGGTSYDAGTLTEAKTIYVKFEQLKTITIKFAHEVTAGWVIQGVTKYPTSGGESISADGTWVTMTFTNVYAVSNIDLAYSGGDWDYLNTSTKITDDCCYNKDGSLNASCCVPRANPTWGTAPASGAIGGSMTATVSGAPDGATITWSSTATSYATVNSSGVISYKAAGSATIKANVSWEASDDYCAGSYELSQAITVTSGATVTATRTCPEYVPAGVAGQVSMHITFTGTSSGWKYRVKQVWNSGYATNWEDASGSSADWTKEGGIDAETRSFVVELYDHEYAPTPVATSSPISVTGENTQTVTIVAGANGTVSPSGEIRANNDHVHPTITATPNEHYHFVNWTSSYPSSAWVASNTDATTTVTATAPGYTITANFAGDQYSITYKDQGDVAFNGSHVDSPSAHPTTHTYGTATTLNLATKTGYTFGGWFDNPACTGEAVISLGATAYTANITLYAKWTEVMSSLSTSCSYDAGTPGYAAPTVSGSATNVGYATTRTITATAAGTGYTFAGWTLTNCTRTDGGSPTATSITIRSNGDGADVSVVANYNEVLTQSTWIVAGGNKIVTTGTTWRTTADANNSMAKKTGHAAESVVYFTVPISTVCSGDNNGNYQFKIYNTSTSKWYGFAATGDSYYLLKAEDGTEKSLVEGNKNIELRAYLTGNYEFKLDYSTSTPKLTVTWPVFNQVRISAASPSDAGNVGDYDLSDPVENVRSVKRTLKANTTYTFKIVYNSDWYGHGTGTFTRSNSTSSNSRTLITSSGNLTLTTDYAGDYTFKFNQSTKALSIDFPEAYKVTYGKGAVDGSSGNSCSAKDIDNGNASVTSNSTWVKKDHRVVMTAPTEDGGYTFDGWFDNNSSTGDAITTAKNCTITVASAETYYACYHEHKTAITINTDGHGTITTPSPNNSPYSLGVATSQAINATASEGYHWNTWTTSGNAALGTTATTASNTAKGNGAEGGTGTVTATFTPNTYTVRFHRNGGAGDVVEQNFTYGVAQNLTANTYTKTGYNFAGWALAADAAVTYADEASVSNLTSTNSGTFHLYAKWTPKTTTITYSQSGTGYGSGGQSTTQTATYDAAMPTPITTPTAANGYAFMGYYDALEPLGNKYYNADGTSARTWNKEDASATMYAYFKKAEITLAFDNEVVLPGGTVGVTPTISPTPVGNTIICWTILHGDDTPLDPQPALTWSEGKLTFAASSYSGTYKVQAVLRTGSSCEGGDELDTETSRFMVAGTHNVTVNYKCGDDVIKASTIMENVEPLNWTDEFTAPDVFGYTFARWDAADGVTIKNGDSDPVTTSTNATIQIKATYNGNLTAVYTQKSMIYFKNTLGWSNVYVNFYTGSYWNNPKGSGNQSVTHRNLAMTRYGETDIWYYDYGAAVITPSLYVSFTSESQSNTEFFWKAGGVNVVYPANYPDAINTDKSSETGFKAATPMFVPLATQDKVTLNQSIGGKADYYNAGYWTMFTPGTGYTLEIYNNSTGAFIKSKTFTSADDLMPMKATLDLEGGTTYKFQIRRGGESSAGVYYGNSGTMTYADHGQGTPWDMTNGPLTMCRITTNAAGDYTFNLSYSGNSSTPPHYRLRIAVDYPVASGDYRLVYKDDVHTKIHPSAIVNKVNDGTDIVSFFVRHDQNPKLYIQQATVNPSTGAVTWNEYPTSGTPTNQIKGDIASAITAGGTEVYNFNLSMNGSGAMTVASAEIYEGNFYIRTDAANSKWDNYRTDPDHLMTYSEYSITHGGYTHYYTHWVDKDETGRKNVKFTIANDYSPCISDTLAREEATGTWANIASFMESGGDLKRSANVRFMWDKRDNSISRAYIDGAQGDYSSNFLYMLNVEAGADKIMKEDGTALTDHKVTFKDNGNWMYEANIKVQPEAQIRLLSNWGTSNTITQYFRGASDATETLLGGSGDTWYDIRIIYDFKTNRLIAGLIPSGTIDEQMAIHADVMFVREHQGDIAQLTFAEKDDKMGAITDIETAFGVIQFNKWTLNNKDKSTHNPLPNPQPSRYERDLFYISFPFRVNLEEVFGFGTYGTHWIIEEYDGAARAANGFWADTETFWRFITNRKGKFLEPNIGYLLALDLDELGESSDVWSNTDQVELYFPSYGAMPNITKSTVIHEVPAHTCTIGPRFAGGDDRRIKDSHWNLMSVPTYVNTKDVTFANTDWITTADEEHVGPNFLYTWTMNDNSLSPTSGVGYTYKAMHAYIVQYCGNVTWTTSVSPTTAPRRNPEAPKDAEYRLELRQNEQTIDQTFVRMSDDEHVTTGFDFNYDLSKEFNKNKANIYTMVTTMMEDGPSVTQTAGNTLPLTEQTTVVPVGVKIVANGDYTFAIPEGTNGVGVTLIDNETGIRTSLSALDYTINLPAGTYDNRFVLEISPVHQSPTGIELLNGENGENGVRKVLIDNILYIVKDGVMYDARGNRVQ